MDFNFAQLSITVQCVDSFQLLEFFSSSGNKFSAACRSNVCSWPDRDCGGCSKVTSCPWNMVFGQKLSSDPSAVKRFQKPSLPFAFSYPYPNGKTDKIQEIEFRLVVVGVAISCINMLFEGFKNVILPFDADVISLGICDYQGDAHNIEVKNSIDESEMLIIQSFHEVMGKKIWAENSIKIRLLSPLRLVENGKIRSGFEFSHFVKSLLRRVSSLAYYYGLYEFDCDFKEISGRAESIVCTDYHFEYVHNQKLSGVVGYGTFEGDFSTFSPFLIAGMYLHVGKGSSYGWGAYIIS